MISVIHRNCGEKFLERDGSVTVLSESSKGGRQSPGKEYKDWLIPASYAALMKFKKEGGELTVRSKEGVTTFVHHQLQH